MPELSHARDLELTSPGAPGGTITYSQRIHIAVLLLLSAWLVFNWFATAQRSVRYYTPLPVWDYWRTAADLPFYRAFDFRILWHQHNEHRIVFPEIVFAADSLLLHGRQLLPMAISFLCYLANWIVLAWAFWSIAFLSRFLRALGILLAGIIIGWQGSAVVLMNTFLLQWTLSQLAALLSLAFLTRMKEETDRNVYLSAMIISAVIATYSSGNGLLLWPILIGAALLLSIRPRQMFALIIAGVLADGLYFIGYQFTGTLSVRKLLSHPLYTLEWIGAYLSMPFGAIKSTQFGVWVGVISLAIVVLLAILAARKHLLLCRAGVVLFGFYLFALLTALLTAAGRIDPTDPTFSAAKPSRYLLGSLVTWGVFILLCLWFSSQSRSRVFSPLIAFLIAASMLAGLPKLRWWLRAVDADHANQQLAALGIKLGLQDPTVELNVFLDPQAVNLWTAGLRENHLSVFYEGLTNWFGRPAHSFAKPIDSTVPGEITYTFPVLDGIEVAGWVDTSELRGGLKCILLVNEYGQIAGFGAKLPSGLPSVVQNPRTPASLGWVGFVNQRCPTRQISAYVAGQKGLFPIQGSVAVPAIQVTLWQRAGPQIQGIQWQMEPSWTPNKLIPNQPFGQGPAGTIYGSWSGNDANTGRISSSIFPAPGNACLILPILQGPRAGGLSAEVVDVDSDQVLASIPFQNTFKQWVFWRLPFAPSVKRLRIVAEDSGKGWGEWLALGNPSLCR